MKRTRKKWYSVDLVSNTNVIRRNLKGFVLTGLWKERAASFEEAVKLAHIRLRKIIERYPELGNSNYLYLYKHPDSYCIRSNRHVSHSHRKEMSPFFDFSILKSYFKAT